MEFETLATGYGLVEAPRPNGEDVLFSDVTGGGVHRWSAGGTEVVLPGRRGIGGMVPHESGDVVVSGRDLSLGGVTLLARPDGVTGFNDLGTDDDGAVLAGALRFHPFKGEAPVPGEVWRLSPEGGAEPLAGPVLWANGIGLSPDADVLFVSDYAAGEVLAFDPDGGGRRVFARVPAGAPDGLAVDVDGRLWVALGAAGAIAVLSPEGKTARTIDVPADFVSSVAFTGERLLVTTIGSLMRAHAGVAGRPVRPART